jgi:hypothetical protein
MSSIEEVDRSMEIPPQSRGRDRRGLPILSERDAPAVGTFLPEIQLRL